MEMKHYRMWGNLESLISKRDLETVDFAASFVLPDGTTAEPGDVFRNCPFLPPQRCHGDLMVRAKTYCRPFMSTPYNKNPYYYYNILSAKLGRNYENLVFAQPVKDWFLATYKTALGARGDLVERNLATGGLCDLPETWGNGNPWFFARARKGWGSVNGDSESVFGRIHMRLQETKGGLACYRAF